jgi:hypothetical protein
VFPDPIDIGEETFDVVDWNLLAVWVGALGTLATAVVAIVAAVYAKGQLDKARNPYVLAFLNPDEQNPHYVDLVFQNFGGGPAFDVRFTIEPRPRESADDAGHPVRDLPLPDEIPLLPPGGEWRTRWDYGPNRAKSELPDRHTGEITYRDRFEHLYRDRLVLDFAPFKAFRFGSPKG